MRCARVVGGVVERLADRLALLFGGDWAGALLEAAGDVAFADDPVAPGALGLVQAHVGGVQQVVGGGVGVLRQAGDPHADGHGDRPPVVDRHRELLDAQAQPLGHHAGDVDVRRAHQQGELLAADTGQHVVLAQHLGELAGDLDKHLVAGLVAPGVVDLLEMVDIEHADGQRAAAAARERQLAAQLLVEVQAVEGAGEVVARHRLELTALERLVDRVLHVEPQHDGRAQLDLVAVAQHRAVGLGAVEAGAVGRAEVEELDLALLGPFEAGVHPRDAEVGERDVAVHRPAHRRDGLAEPVHAARECAHEQGQIRPPRTCRVVDGPGAGHRPARFLVEAHAELLGVSGSYGGARKARPR